MAHGTRLRPIRQLWLLQKHPLLLGHHSLDATILTYLSAPLNGVAMNGVRIATDGPTFLHARSRSSILLCCLRLIPSHTSLPAPPSTPLPAVPMVHAGCNGSHLAVGALGVMNGVEDRD